MFFMTQTKALMPAKKFSGLSLPPREVVLGASVRSQDRSPHRDCPSRYFVRLNGDLLPVLIPPLSFPSSLGPVQEKKNIK